MGRCWFGQQGYEINIHVYRWIFCLDSNFGLRALAENGKDGSRFHVLFTKDLCAKCVTDNKLFPYNIVL